MPVGIYILQVKDERVELQHARPLEHKTLHLGHGHVAVAVLVHVQEELGDLLEVLVEPRSHLLQFSPVEEKFTRQAFPTELRDVGAMVPAPSGELLALVRTRTVDGKKEQSLEIWNGDMLLATVKANAEQHGDIYTADVFSSFEWSPDSSRLLYVAEAPKPKAKSFWSQNCSDHSNEGAGKEHEYQDDWGELSTGKCLSRMFVLHIPTKTQS